MEGQPVTPPTIGIVGPLHPYRGGIAAHTTRMRMEMIALGIEVNTYAFRNPFPKTLYPGEYQGDLSNHPECIENINYQLSYHIPGKWPATLRQLIEHKVDVVIIPWWTFFFAPHYGWLSRQLKAKNIPVIFLCHNLFDHESAVWKKALTRWALCEGSAFIFHSPDEAAKCNQAFGETPTLVFPHPLYDHLPTNNHPKQRDDRINLLFFGLVRTYKGLSDLLDAIELLNDPNIKLIVAGEWWGQQKKLKERCRKLVESNRIILKDYFLSNEEAAEEFAHCDVVVLPYQRATNSGVLAHAIHEKKPVVATRTGALPLCIEENETGFLANPCDAPSLARAIKNACAKIRNQHDFKPAIERIGKRMSWKEFTQQTILFIEDLIA